MSTNSRFYLKMNQRFLAFITGLALAWNFAGRAETAVGTTFSHPDRIRYDGQCLTIDGRDTFIRSAAFHYFRTPRELWRDRFQKIKEAGFNTVETYVPWNWHERDMPASLDDFSKVDLSEAEAWLQMAQDEFGFYTIVRPGPFICAEWAGGGYPRWLAKFAPGTGKDFWLRTAEDAHIGWSVHWYEAVCKVFAREQLTRKPKGGKGIILVQIENEYDRHKCPDKPKLLRALFNAVTNAGVHVPIFTCLTRECRGSSDPVLSQVFDCDNYYVGLSAAPSCAQRMMSLRARQPDAPGFVTELQGGWFALVGDRLSEEHYSDARHYNSISLMSLLGGATGLNTYMFVGGTHFGGWQARGQTTSYDYNAAIREWGARGPKYAVAEAINQFICENEAQLLRAEGGPCELQGAPTNLFGGVRVGPDGTRFVFLDNTDPKNPVCGKVTAVPGKLAKPIGPIYNIDQNGNRVLLKPDEAVAQSVVIPPFEVDYELGALGAKVLVIPPGKVPAEGAWYPKPQKPIAPPATLPAAVRLASALKRNDPLDGQWQALPAGKSLPELGVNDQRYVLYRARFSLAAIDATNLSKLLINTFTRDIVSAQVNGQLAKRLYPSDAYAAAATRNTKKSFTRIGPDEFDNRFDVGGQLCAGTNEIVLLYENIGFEHGYFPMEELSGVRQAGLSGSEEAIARPLEWQVATNLGGVTAAWMRPDCSESGWDKLALDTTSFIPRKGNGIQPKERQDALFTWYRLEFELPERPAAGSLSWRLLLNASGNGCMWLNGHDIGRHWEAGPQREFYLPECWLKFGGAQKNVLVLGLRQTTNGAKLNAAEVSPYPVLANVGSQSSVSTNQALFAQVAAPKPWGNWSHWGDQGDGTYRNPVLPSDYSDLDCIRVGADYYAISSTFQYSPGVVILRSKDLVNWQVLGHAVDDVTQIGPEMNWDRMSHYGTGIWAGGIRFHDGKFWVYFGTPNEGYFMTTANNPAGPWEPLHCVRREAGWDDCCPFWDEDGQGYFVGTCFKDGYKTWLFKLTPDGRDLVSGWRVLLNQGSGREANKLYKINGTYYHLFSEHKGGVGRYVMMQRATNIAGPYTEARQLSHAQPEAHEPNQGGLVQTEQGGWYFFTHHGTGDWEGRCASVLPVTWVNGWPIIGQVGEDGIGKMVWSGPLPVTNSPIVTPQTDDEFKGPKLGVQWEWNYQPRAEKWSLTERPGFLRLHAFKPLELDNLKKAGNTLTQRALRTGTNVVTLALDLSGMAEGQVAGLCHYSRDYSTIGVRRENGILTLELAHNQTRTRGPALMTRKLWLRSIWGLDGKSHYAYSTNGTVFTPFGEVYRLGWGDYRGDRIGIFTYNNAAEAGYVDCDSFTYCYVHRPCASAPQRATASAK